MGRSRTGDDFMGSNETLLFTKKYEKCVESDERSGILKLNKTQIRQGFVVLSRMVC
jgi:hypothetical protein